MPADEKARSLAVLRPFFGRPMRRILPYATTIGYLLALAVLSFDALLVASSLGTILEGNRQVIHCRQVLFELERVISLLKDAETGQRGYLLTEHANYLAPFRVAETDLNPAIDSLRLIIANDGLEDRVDALSKIASEKMAELRQTVRLVEREHDRDEALRILKTDLGKNLMDQARSLEAEIRHKEELILTSREAATRSAVARTLVTFGLTTGLALILLAGSASFQRREAKGRERAAAAIRASEAWLSTTLSSIGDAVIATDDKGLVRFLNPVAQNLTGWSQAEAKGRSMAEVFPIINETTRLPVKDPVAEVLLEGAIVGLANHTLLIRRDGHETPIDDSAAPIRDDEGKVAGVVLVFRDITERKRQEALVEEQRRLAEFGRDVGLAMTESHDLPTIARRCAEETVRHLDGAFARIWVVDEAGEVLELLASAGMYTHIDGPHARVPVGRYKIGAIARDREPHLTNSVIGDPFVPAQEWAEKEGMVAFAGYPLVVEDRLVGVWAMFARHELSDATLRSMESVARGIAVGIERYQTDEKLRREREWLRVTLASIGDAVIATDDRGLVKFLNPVAQGLTGWSPLEAAGQPVGQVFAIINEQTRLPAENPVDRVIRDGTVVGLANHTVVIARDGTETPIEDSAAPIKDDDGDVVGVVMVFQDATERRRHEASLRLAKEEAEQASAAKTQFLAVLSHELRTPLNPILLAVSAMLERPTSHEDVQANLEMIRQNVNLQSRLIDDLLDVMRIVRGKMPLHWEVVDAHVLINHSVGICQSEVFGKGLQLTLDLGANCHHINADPVRLQQVFWNLIKNAVKFTQSGGLITIRTRNETDGEPARERLVIEVADTGIGIEPEVVGRIFDPFQQGETSITRQFGGLGLGLAISKGIVEGHGGVLRAQSPGKNQGTTFRLELQALPDPKSDDAGPAPPRVIAADANSSASPLRILLVEDEQATSRLMARLLKGLGHDVATAATIAEALERERADEFGLIISDIGLPDGSGLELLKKVVARRGQVPAIALTGYGMEEDILRSREAGFTAHMTKPIDFAKLEAMIRQVAS
jgi:PAS domain S-box-containing protein